VDEAHDPLPIDQEGNAPTAVQGTDRSVAVIDEREADAVFPGKGLMGVETVAADAQHLGVTLAKVRQIPLESDQFIASDRGEVGEVEGKDELLPAQFAEP